MELEVSLDLTERSLLQPRPMHTMHICMSRLGAANEERTCTRSRSFAYAGVLIKVDFVKVLLTVHKRRMKTRYEIVQTILGWRRTLLTFLSANKLNGVQIGSGKEASAAPASPCNRLLHFVLKWRN